VVLKIVEPLQEILVDPVQIEQVLKNLVENALKYSPPESSVLVEVSQSDSYTTVEVKDKGRGILTADKPLIFDRFYRARGLSESTIAGVGVGLTICKALVEAHKGQITALDNPEGGTIMRVTLPMQEQKEGR
ncbi:MAG TPA: ATP-binding protein, partial [Candidatus Obscuribacter sp.]|nr:ATP-binding protein [Candidatus Obscuribacter sp.]